MKDRRIVSFHPRASLRRSGQRKPKSGTLGYVSIQRPEYGGGEIYFDGKLIRKNGVFLQKQRVR